MNGQYEFQPGEKLVDLTNHAGETPQEEREKKVPAPPPEMPLTEQGGFAVTDSEPLAKKIWPPPPLPGGVWD